MAQSVLLLVEGDEPVELSLDRFFEANSFEVEERAEIRSAIVMHGVYRGGGGAAPIWMLATGEHLRGQQT